MTFVVGIDGGGTRTRAVVLDEGGAEVGRAEGPGCVATVGAPEDAARAVIRVARAAAADAGLLLPATALWAGLAGAGRPDAAAGVSRALAREHLAGEVHVGTDAEAAFHDAFQDGPGILLIAGTGSIAWARSPAGERVRVGGWGERVGDEGSGYAIGMSALRRVLRAADGRDPPTRLTEPVLGHCGVTEPSELVGWTEAASKSEVAALVPVVSEAAARLEPAAMSILERAVRELEAHVAASVQLSGPWEGPAPLVLWGGLLAEGGPLRSAALQVLDHHPVRVSPVKVDPPTGAARLALRLL